MKLQVLYEDNHLIAVFKPSGILSQGDKTGDTSIFDEVKKYLKEKYKKSGNVFLGLVHRLDRPVSGIILFAKTSKGASRLSEQFRNRAIEKTYHAVIAGKPEKEKGILVHNLIKIQNTKSQIPNKFKAQNSKFKTARSKEATLYYEVVKSSGKYSLLKIKIDTGKFHQIRAQLSLAGFPILGDVKYLPTGRQAAQEWNNKNAIALCATNLCFHTATEYKKISLSIPTPGLWDTYFNG